MVERTNDLLRDDARILRLVQFAQDDRKLVAAQAAHCIAGTYGRVEACGNLAQQFIADAVPQSVVHRLEAIQIDEQHPGVPLIALRLGDHLGKTVVKQHPVRQFGQRIVVREVQQLFFEVLLFGDVDQITHYFVVVAVEAPG